uniref:Catalase n=1 Tax=Peronospora matthiolae TaxID=2874970 RepID=A0AAV1UHU5_9STRA
MTETPTSTTTTSVGTSIPSPGLTTTTTAGPLGPIVLEDFTLLDRLAHFDHERIPERVVHAKGGGAFGYFEVTHADITKYCSAKLFSNVGKRTPVALRFSTVGGEQGSADTVRDPRGFAIKFYTEEGNWDLVGNNTPIFFVRDPMLFPSFIHTQKRLPHSHLKDPDMMWDFFSLRPETLHQQSFLFTDRGIPDGFRFMNGYGSHAFCNVNAKGETSYVKYHFKTDQGIRNLSVDKAAELAGSNPDYAVQDLYEAIAKKQYPSWTLYIQVMSLDEAAKATFNPFDVTKTWPHSAYPLIEVGRLALNRNPRNYFAEIEQLAFSPSFMVPGIEPSPDKMLQGRLFSYPDTQRHRLGTNYLQIPVNRPLKVPQTYQRDGAMVVNGNMYEAPNYYPNSKGGPSEDTSQRHRAYRGDFSVVDKYSTYDDDNYSQVGEFYRKTLDAAGREHLTDNIATSLVNASKPVQARAIANFTKCDEDYGRRVQEKVDALAAQKKHEDPTSLPAPSQLNPPRKPFEVAPPSDVMTPRL